jgi:hypothetical protein
MLSKFLIKNKDLLVGVLKSVLLGFLKLQASGGIKGWIIRTILTEFAEEVIEFITVNVDYAEMKNKVRGTINEENREQATDDLNDIMR